MWWIIGIYIMGAVASLIAGAILNWQRWPNAHFSNFVGALIGALLWPFGVIFKIMVKLILW